jgi:Ca2+-binding RTX toxin-like protein
MPATEFDDVLTTTSDGEVLRGLGGNDRLTSVHNHTTLFGDAGDDVLITRLSSDQAYARAVQSGGEGNDVLLAAVRAEISAEIVQEGGDGDDEIVATAVVYPFEENTAATTRTFGGGGHDRINVTAVLGGMTGTAMNVSSGGDGNDYIVAHAETEFGGFTSYAYNLIDGGDGDDIISATAIGWSNGGDTAENHLIGGNGNDSLRAEAFSDSNSGSARGRNTLEGGDGNDRLEAIHRTDGENTTTDVISVLDGGDGNDLLFADSIALADDFVGSTAAAVHNLSGGTGDDSLNSHIVARASYIEARSNLHGGEGDDSLISSIDASADSWTHTLDASNLLSGGAGDDRLEARIAINVVDEWGEWGEGVEDATSYTKALNELFGGSGNDTLLAVIETTTDSPLVTASGSSHLFGGDGDDALTVVGGDANILEGGAGNDTLIGGAGSDAFVFNFNVETEQGQTLYFRGGNTPSTNASQRAWDNYIEQLDAWRSELMSSGADLDTSTTSSTVSGKKGSAAATYVYDNSYTLAGDTSVTGEGFDVVHGFGEGDSLQLNGLTSSEFLNSFNVSVRDFDGDGTLDTILSWGEDDAGIVLLDVQYQSAEDLLNSGDLLFG